MTAAVIRAVELAKPSPKTLRMVETVLTIALLAQMVGIVIRYTI